MSRKGKLPILLPKGVEVKLENNEVTVKGPKGSLLQELPVGININQEDQNMMISVDDGIKNFGKFHGLYRSLIANMILGVSQGFEKQLEMIGVGFRAAVKGNLLDLQVGFSHPTEIEIPKNLTVKVEKNTLITISGSDKQAVGQFAASIREKRPPEPYKGKGIRYKGEYVRKKAGKAAAK